MFFMVSLDARIRVEAAYFGAQLNDVILQRLESSLVGQCTERYGFVLHILSHEIVGRGKLDEEKGCAVFVVRYKAIVFRLFRGEVVDGVVSDINAVGIIVKVGPIHVFVSSKMIPGLDFNATEHCYVSSDGTARIVRDDDVRLRILNTKRHGTTITAIGSMREDYLGV